MTDNKNPAFLLKEAGNPSGEFKTVMGLRLTALSLSNNSVAAIDEEHLSYLISDEAVTSVIISAAGIFLGSRALTVMLRRASASLINGYMFRFEHGLVLQGKFIVSKLSFSGSHAGEKNYKIQLKSSGKVEVV